MNTITNTIHVHMRSGTWHRLVNGQFQPNHHLSNQFLVVKRGEDMHFFKLTEIRRFSNYIEQGE